MQPVPMPPQLTSALWTRRRTLLQTLPLTAVLMSQALADNSHSPWGPWYLSDQPSGWYYDAFLGAEYEPTYAGSDENAQEPELNIRAFYRTQDNRRYFVSLGEAGGIFQITPDLMFSAVLEYEEGRDGDDDDTLEGLDEVDDTVEGQITLAYRFLPNTYAAAVFQPDLLGKGKGLVYFAGVGQDIMLLSKQLRLSTKLDFSFANSEHMRTEFGVTERESAATGLSSYRPSGGLKSVTGTFGLEYGFAKRWSALFDVELEYYLGDAADSPLIREEGSQVTYELAAGIRYQF